MTTKNKLSAPVRTLSISFNLPIYPRQIPQWRGAFIEMAGWEDALFHNHKGDKEYHYRYPKLQYRVRRKNASIFAVNEGVDALQQVLATNDWKLNWQGEVKQLQIEDLGMYEHRFRFLQAPQKYRLRKWMALNPENHQRWESCNGLLQRIGLLERLLRNHLLAGLWGMGWEPREQVSVQLERIDRTGYLPFHGTKLLAFDVTFSANVFLPPGMAIGKGVSLGFGWMSMAGKKAAVLLKEAAPAVEPETFQWEVG